MTLLALCFAAVVTAVLLATAGRVTAFCALLGYQGFFLVGMLRLADDGSTSVASAEVFLAGVSALALGYIGATLLGGSDTVAEAAADDAGTAGEGTGDAGRGKTGTGPESRTFRPEYLVLPLAGTLALTVYHFAKVGLPILAPDVELARWNFAGSGLFGMPSRAYLVGLPLLAIVSWFAHRSRPTPLSHRLLTIAVVATLATRIIGGFKGEVLELVVLAFIVDACASGGRNAAHATRRYLLPAGAALGFAAAVSVLYASAGSGAGDTSASDRIVDRMTVTAARPTSLVIDARKTGQSFREVEGDTIANDVAFYATRYVPVLPVDPDRYDFKTVVSATMNNRPLTQARTQERTTFVVPVTPGFVAIAFYNYGWLFVPILVLVGVGFRLVERSARRARSAPGFLVSVTAIVALVQGLHKGDVVFQLSNWLTMAGLVAGAIVLSRDLARGAVAGGERSPERAAPARPRSGVSKPSLRSTRPSVTSGGPR